VSSKQIPIRLTLALSLSLSMTNCVMGNGQEDPVATKTTEDAVQGGTAISATAFPATGRMTLGSSNVANYCTGTLIGPRTVLTAGHCSDREVLGSVIPGLPPYDTFAISRSYYKGTIYPHPSYKDGISPSTNVDIALFVLDSAPPSTISRACLARTAPAVGSQLYIVGYGGPNGPQTQKRYGTEKVLRPSAGDNLNQMFWLTSTTNHYEQGDSGGPAASATPPSFGDTKIWGIAVAGNTDGCVTVAQHINWIKQKTASVGGVNLCN